MNTRKLLLVALGAVSSSDALKMKKMPRFGALAARGTLVTGVDPVFVSSAYPGLTSIVTGVHPVRHQIADHLLPTHDAFAWRREHRFVKAPTLYDRARKAGHSVCASMWPATGGAEIPFHLPDVFPSAHPLAASLKLGGGGFALRSFLRHGRRLSGMNQPGLDDFALQSTLDCLRREHPVLTLLRFSDLDCQKHEFGPNSSEARDALERYDKRVGLLVDALWDAGTLSDTDIILCGDHGCLPVTQTVDLDRYLGELKGLVDFHQSGGIACLRLRKQEDIELQKRAAHMIKDILEDPSSGAYRVLSVEEMEISGLNRSFDIALEASAGCAFGKKQLKGAHGYTPHHNDYQTFYLAVGPHVPEDFELTGGCVTDVCPLAVRLLDLAPWDMDGTLHIPLRDE